MSTLKAEDYEAAVVISWNNLNKVSFDLKDSGITKKTYHAVINRPDVMAKGMLAATTLLAKFPEEAGWEAKTTGATRVVGGLTEEWKSYGARNSTPKCDILVGSKRVSLKMGVAQLMSGSKAETMATLMTACKNANNMPISVSVQLEKVIASMSNLVESGNNSKCMGQLRPMIKSGLDENVNRGEKAHKDFMFELKRLLRLSPTLAHEFAKEAMSGINKFGKDSCASAEWVLHVGMPPDDDKIEINNVNDKEYVRRIVDKMRVSARFKSGSVKKMVDGVRTKTGEYRYFSVLTLHC